MVLWTAGSGPVSKEGVGEGGLKLPFPANDRGAVRTDATLRVVDHPRVFALGDVSGCDASGEASTSAPSLAPTAQACSSPFSASFSATPDLHPRAVRLNDWILRLLLTPDQVVNALACSHWDPIHWMTVAAALRHSAATFSRHLPSLGGAM